MTTPIDRESVEYMGEWLRELPCCLDYPKETTERCKHCEVIVADTLLALRSALDAAEAENQRLREALQSIASNTCCDTCQEAALVARAALQEAPHD